MAEANIEHAHRQHDRRMRRHLLQAMHVLRGHGDGRVSGLMLLDMYGPDAGGTIKCRDEAHLLTLLGDLVRSGYAIQHRLERRKGQAWGIEFVEFEISAKGVSLIEESIAPHPDIEDQRIT